MITRKQAYTALASLNPAPIFSSRAGCGECQRVSTYPLACPRSSLSHLSHNGRT